MRPLRILFLADFDPNPNSGAAGTELELANELERQGHEIVRVWGDSLPHRVRHWNLHHLLEQPRTYRDAIRRLSGEKPFDVYHVNQPQGYLAAREHRRLRRPGIFVHRSHGFEPRIGEVVRRWSKRFPEDRRPLARRAASRLRGPWLQRQYRECLRWSDAHVVSCGECADYIAARGVSRDRVHVSPQVPTQEFVDRPVAPWSAERARRILFVGQHRFFKAPMILAAVFDALAARHPDLELTWITEESAHEEVRARLRPETRERVRLVGWMSRSRLVDEYDRHGIFLFPSLTEGFGKVFLEAMARGLCVVASRQGGALDVLSEGSGGLLVDVGDAKTMIVATERLRADPNLAARTGDEARRLAVTYTWARVAASLSEFYLGLREPSGARAGRLTASTGSLAEAS